MKELIDFIALALIYFWKFYRKWKLKGKDILFINTVMYVYLSFVLYFTLMPILTSLLFIFNHPYSSMNLVPFVDLINSRGDAFRQVVLNIIMTLPFGFLLPLVRKNINLLKVVFYTFALSLSIEIIQPLINGSRSSDITDVITNVIGGIFGYLTFLIFKPLINKMLYLIKDK